MITGCNLMVGACTRVGWPWSGDVDMDVDSGRICACFNTHRRNVVKFPTIVDI